MTNPRHREAEALLTKQAVRQRSEYVVSSILTSHQAEYLEQAVREAIREELQNIRLPPQAELTGETEASVQLADLPDSLIHALEEL